MNCQMESWAARPEPAFSRDWVADTSSNVGHKDHGRQGNRAGHKKAVVVHEKNENEVTKATNTRVGSHSSGVLAAAVVILGVKLGDNLDRYLN